MAAPERVILHCDCNNYFASVELLDHNGHHQGQHHSVKLLVSDKLLQHGFFLRFP